MRSRTLRILTLTAFTLAMLLAGPVLAEKQEPAANRAAGIAAPPERLAPREPGSGVPGATGSRSGFPSTNPPIDYLSPADFSEGFIDITLLPAAGWFFQNNSDPLGTIDWFQGNDTVFPAHAGASTEYIGANYNSTAGTGTISNWMLTPEIDLANGDTLSFWTRSIDSSFPDRLEVRLSTAGASTDVGTLATDVGDFTTVLVEINPTLTVGGYPGVWTQFTATLSGIPPATTGRIGFRYFVTDGGPTGSNSDYIGIDTVEFTEAPDALTLTKTVGTVPATCAATDAITVPYGTPIYYCFQVENTTATTFNFHDLVDDHLGTILTNANVPLAPAGTYEVIVADTATATVTNTATWTARDQNPGYSANDTAPFSFIDISATGTPLNLIDDAEANVTMPFSFSFFGVTSADLRVGDNGGILFGVTAGELGFGNVALPVAAPARSILPFWDDLDEGTTGSGVFWETQGVAPNRQFIVEWFNRSHYSNIGAVTFEVILFEGSNDILFQYLDTDFGNATFNAGLSATAGLNQDATLANQYSFNTAVLTDNKAILWTLGTVTEASSTDTATVTVDFPPDIVVSPANLASTQAPDTQVTLPLDIENIGSGDLIWTIDEAAPAPFADAPDAPGAYLNQLPNQVNGLFADSDCVPNCGTGQQSVAENFTLAAPATIGQITFWGGYFSTDVPLATDLIRVLIHSDAGGVPGAVVYDESNVASTRVQTGILLFGVHEWEFTLTLAAPVNLGAGTWWVELFNNTTGSSEIFFWEIGNLDGTNGLTGSVWTTATPGVTWTFDSASELAIQIDGPSSACFSPSDLPWASVNPAAGTTAPAATTVVDVTFDSTGLLAGLYEGLLCVNSNDPDTPLVEVPVALTVDTMPFLDGFETNDTSRWSVTVGLP